MIQRKQTLFLFLAGLMNVILLFTPSKMAVLDGKHHDVSLVALRTEGISSTVGHTAAIYLNFGTLVLTLAIVFLYARRELQVKLCLLAAVLWLVIGAMLALCPFVVKTDRISAEYPNYLACLVALLGAGCALLAARFVKKDIDLLRSADRIR